MASKSADRMQWLLCVLRTHESMSTRLSHTIDEYKKRQQHRWNVNKIEIRPVWMLQTVFEKSRSRQSVLGCSGALSCALSPRCWYTLRHEWTCDRFCYSSAFGGITHSALDVALHRQSEDEWSRIEWVSFGKQIESMLGESQVVVLYSFSRVFAHLTLFSD